MSIIKDPEKALQALIGRRIEGIEIDTDDETCTLVVSGGKILFEGESLELYVEVDDALAH